MLTKGKKKAKKEKNWRKILTPQIIACFIGIILLGVGAVFLSFFPPIKPISQTSEIYELGMTSGLANGTKLQQSFIAPVSADSFGIYFDNYSVFLESGSFDITITKGSSEVFHQSIEVAQLDNEQFFYLDCNLTAGDPYNLTLIIHDLDDIDRVSFMTTNIMHDSPLIIDGTKQNTNLILSYVRHTPDYFSIWYCIFGIILLAIYIVLFISLEGYEK